MRTRATCVAVLLSLGVLAASASADVQLPSVIGDNMVLQRQVDAPIWGWDAAGTNVTVSFRGAQATVQAGQDGKWLVRVPAGEAGGPFDLKVTGSSEATVRNVLVGEVWVAGGQSNMWWAVSNCDNAQQEIAAANLPDIRLYDANNAPREAGWRADEPQRTIAASWQVTSPQTVGGFPGVAYFFARELHKELGVPVGIVHVAVPGTQIEPWLSEPFARAHLPLQMELWDLRKKQYPADLKAHEDALAAWEKAAAEARQKGEQEPQKPQAPSDPANAPRPGTLFNGMVYPCAPFAMRGFLWWQGESNASRSLEYSVLFPSLIREWRRLWGRDDAPFMFVELANFMGRQTRPVEDDQWPAQRDAQHTALRVHDTYMVSAIDVLPADAPNNIHPPNKQLVGRRLFLVAMANVYGKRDLVWSGPHYRAAEFDGALVTVRFDHLGSGLTAKDGAELKGFALAGGDRRFYWADAVIDGGAVVLTSAQVPQPVAVRYGWANNPIGDLYNKEGLPASPFRSDDWLLTIRGQD